MCACNPATKEAEARASQVRPHGPFSKAVSDKTASEQSVCLVWARPSPLCPSCTLRFTHKNALQGQH